MNNFLFTFLVYIAFGVAFWLSSGFCFIFRWLKNFESNIMLRPALPHQIRSQIFINTRLFSQLRTPKGLRRAGELWNDVTIERSERQAAAFFWYIFGDCADVMCMQDDVWSKVTSCANSTNFCELFFLSKKKTFIKPASRPAWTWLTSNSRESSRKSNISQRLETKTEFLANDVTSPAFPKRENRGEAMESLDFLFVSGMKYFSSYLVALSSLPSSNSTQIFNSFLFFK